MHFWKAMPSSISRQEENSIFKSKRTEKLNRQFTLWRSVTVLFRGGQKVDNGRKQSVTRPVCIKWYISVISLQNKGSTAPVSMAFVPCLLSCADILFSCPCLVDQGCAALLRVPLKSLPSLSDVLPPLNTLAFCRTDQRPERNSSKGIIQK